MTLENRGIPTVVVCTGPFIDSAHVHARMLGRTGFQPVSIPHPLGGLSSEGVSQRVAVAEEQIISALTTPFPRHSRAGGKPDQGQAPA